MSSTQTITRSEASEAHDVDTKIYYVKEAEDSTTMTIEAVHRHDPRFRDVRRTTVKDVRKDVASYTLEKNGFRYVYHDVPQEHFKDEETIKTVHYPEMEKFILKTTGAKEVIVYNHIVRNSPWSTTSKDLKQYTGPAHRCHIDVSSKFAPEVAKMHLEARNKDLSVLDGRWQLLNIWRPLKTVRKHPLAVADARTVPDTDQCLLKYERTAKVEGEEKTISVETLFTLAGDGHQFYYMHEQQPNEVLIFKTADNDESAVGAVTHTSFEVPGTEDLPTRESIEMRVLVVY